LRGKKILNIKNKKVIIITYDMIPHATTWGGSQRMYFLADFLVRKGIDTSVFSCEKKTINDYGNKINFKQYQLKINNRFYKKIIDSKSSTNFDKDNSSKNKLKKFIKSNKLLFQLLRKIDRKIFNEPSFLAGVLSRSWVKSYYSEINTYIQKNNISTVIISGPPFGMFLIGKKIKLKHSVRVIYDYRDPWNLWYQKSMCGRIYERNYLKYSDTIVCTNNNLIVDMAKKYKIKPDKFLLISNGFSNNSWIGIDTKYYKKNKKLTISYIGIMDMSKSSNYGYRNISILLEAFDKCLKEGKDIKLVFVGVVNPFSNYSLLLKDKYGDNIEIVGVKSSNDANNYMIASDALLLLHTVVDSSSKYIISGKMYDYIKSNRYILSIGEETGLHNFLIEEYNLGINCQNKKENIYFALNYIYSKWLENKLTVSMLNIEMFSREYQNKLYYLNIINN